MQHKLRVGVFYGGPSAEHDISLMSATNVINALDTRKYDIIPVGIDLHGKMYLQKLSLAVQGDRTQFLTITQHLNSQVALVPGHGHGLLINLLSKEKIQAIDVIIPVIHGSYGEDGTIQGLIKAANVPCVGADVLSSAICMDKDIAKRLLRDAGLPVADFITLHKHSKKNITPQQIIKHLGLPCFVKPANLGSSIGIHKVKDQAQLETAIDNAFQYDNKILIEKFIQAREIECAVLGNDELKVSLPGEVIPRQEFYSYDAKYFDEDGADIVAIADLDKQTQTKIQTLAMETFHCLECKGMARVDFFLTKSGDIYINEVNTMPGFTQISQYPKMWEASGIPCPELLDELINLALAQFDTQKSLKITP